MTRKETRISSYVWLTVYDPADPPTDDELDCGKSLVEPTPVKTPAAVGKSTPRRSLLKSADRLRGNTIVSAAGAAIKAKNQWDVRSPIRLVRLPSIDSSAWITVT